MALLARPSWPSRARKLEAHLGEHGPRLLGRDYSLADGICNLAVAPAVQHGSSGWPHDPRSLRSNNFARCRRVVLSADLFAKRTGLFLYHSCNSAESTAEILLPDGTLPRSAVLRTGGKVQGAKEGRMTPLATRFGVLKTPRDTTAWR